MKITFSSESAIFLSINEFSADMPFNRAINNGYNKIASLRNQLGALSTLIDRDVNCRSVMLQLVVESIISILVSGNFLEPALNAGMSEKQVMLLWCYVCYYGAMADLTESRVTFLKF
ncbi:MAG: hypothetical protein U9N40_01730 [Euryarchaeota archaeon]|nr:hypothetical protein [Euryarchaeota archaeon]